MEEIIKIISEIFSKATTLDGITTIATAIGSISFTKKIIKELSPKTKLVKKDIIEDFELISEAPRITKINKTKHNIENEPEIKEIISNFVITLNKNLTHEQIQKVNENIETLQYQKLDTTNKIRFFLRGISGIYRVDEHSITSVFSQDKEHLKHIIYHELIHASTSLNTEENNFCGFAQKKNKKNQGIGRAINEGYTELLTRRYFGNDSKKGYEYEVSVAKMVEFIIGKEKMQDLFFKNNLKGLITELEKYSNINKATQFISNLDLILELNQSKQNDKTRQTLSHLYNQVNIFQYEIFSKKVEQYSETSKYFEESNKFQQLFSEITNNNKFNEDKINKKDPREEIYRVKKFIQSLRQDQTLDISQTHTNQREKSKTLIKKIPSNNSIDNKKGFIDIIAVIFLIIVITSLSIAVSYLIIQARQ